MHSVSVGNYHYHDYHDYPNLSPYLLPPVESSRMQLILNSGGSVSGAKGSGCSEFSVRALSMSG